MAFLKRTIGCILIIFAVILPHELGHFVTARVTGVAVSRFSIGFGPVLISKQIRDTEWVISAIPFGGYVMLKEGTPETTKTAASADSLSYQRPVIRFLIAVSGSIVNFIMALLLVPVLGRMILSSRLTADDFELRSERKKRGGCIGPIGIIQLTGEAAVRGKGATLALIARFSVGIGMLQLLPIPILDGNQALHSLLVSGSGLPYTLPDLIMIALLIMSTYSLYRLAAVRLFFLRQLLPPAAPLMPENYED